MKKSYILNLEYGNWKNQLWFMGGDTPKHAEAFEKAKKTLPAVSAGCANTNDFFNCVCSHFESCGFLRIQK